MHKMYNKHIFCIVCHDLDLSYDQEIIVLSSTEHIQRIVTILRLKIDDNLIIFNKTCKALTQIKEVHTKRITLRVIQWTLLKALAPSITLLLPLLKKTAFEQALYSATEHGVNHFIFYTSNKSQSNFNHFNKQRIENTIIAAAEQSHNYVYPTTEGPYVFNQALLTTVLERYACCIFMDSIGTPVRELAYTLNYASYGLLIGPEGDLDPNEKTMIDNSSFISMQLTPTVLRAYQAAGTAVGFVRALSK